MHLRKRQLGAAPVFGLFLNRLLSVKNITLSPNTGLFLAYFLNYQPFTVVRPYFLTAEATLTKNERKNHINKDIDLRP